MAAGAANLRRHIEIVRGFGVTPVVAINAFPTDFPTEHDAIRDVADDAGVRVAVARPVSDGGKGCVELAEAVSEAVCDPQAFRFGYDLDLSLIEKIGAVARDVYGADGVDLSPAAAAASRPVRAAGLRRPAGRHRQDASVAVFRPEAARRADWVAVADPRRPGGSRRRLCVRDQWRHARPCRGSPDTPTPNASTSTRTARSSASPRHRGRQVQEARRVRRGRSAQGSGVTATTASTGSGP